ncbi:MAG: hypothetical protein WC812_02880 [Candidatus Pacearchaeota archaeon]|jgi:hypothetical protein
MKEISLKEAQEKEFKLLCTDSFNADYLEENGEEKALTLEHPNATHYTFSGQEIFEDKKIIGRRMEKIGRTTVFVPKWEYELKERNYYLIWSEH